MLEGFGLLLAGYGLVMFWTAIIEFRSLLEIKKNGKSVPGTVVNDRAVPTVQTRQLGGPAYRAVIRYQPAKGGAMELWVRGHTLLMKKKYENGQRVEVIYAADAPQRAYPMTHWKDTLRDIWLGAAALIGGPAMIAIGKIFLTPGS